MARIHRKDKLITAFYAVNNAAKHRKHRIDQEKCVARSFLAD
ncbi:hypothetical protein [Cupriavidus sp. YR651]|nr:hypothetical protein [Cupriavidus sp. YR651]